ncbi:MAG: MerR family DNA-binding transcriptional regulator [Raoultibacter sp.]
MKNELLSIGEVSKMKNVGVKSLRYYERLGILIPAYVDGRSGYRYYSMNQMIDIDIIITCIELGIPLKDLAAYLKPNGSLDITALLGRGRAIAVDNLRKAQSAVFQIDDCLKEADAQKEFGATQAPYQRILPDRTVLLLPWHEQAFQAKHYVTAITELYQEAKQLGYIPLYLQGMVFFPGESQRSASVYLEVHIPPHLSERTPNTEHTRLDTLGGGLFTGKHLIQNGFENCFIAAFEETAKIDTAQGSVVATEVWGSELSEQHYLVELLINTPVQTESTT